VFLVFLVSGLFLGWSLGANDAANVYGTAVGTRMISFRAAALACSAFVILGAVIGGAGASDTLGELGSVNAPPGAFAVALAAALSVTWMTRLGIPVSTSQAIVGAIIGWNFFSGSLTDLATLTKIVGSWVLCPVLAAIFAVVLLKLAQGFLRLFHFHILRVDTATRYGLVAVGAFASYSLGANNIANVMGVFVPSAPFGDLDVFGLFRMNAAQQLFLIGGVAIAVGVFTYSKRVMLTVGSDLFRLSPITALIVVLAQALVLFLFSSEGLEHWLSSRALPTIPLVPVSSSQAVIGAVIGIGIAKGGRNIRVAVLGRISGGWLATPVIAAAISFVLLFFVQNVFSQRVYTPVRYQLSGEVAEKLAKDGAYHEALAHLLDQEFGSAVEFSDALQLRLGISEDRELIISRSRIQPLEIAPERAEALAEQGWLSDRERATVLMLRGRHFRYAWQLADALAALSEDWRPRPPTTENKLFNQVLRARLKHLERWFATPEQPSAEGAGRR
jgi:PiT family inorganic phosphate transporter